MHHWIWAAPAYLLAGALCIFFARFVEEEINDKDAAMFLLFWPLVAVCFCVLILALAVRNFSDAALAGVHLRRRAHAEAESAARSAEWRRIIEEGEQEVEERRATARERRDEDPPPAAE